MSLFLVRIVHMSIMDKIRENISNGTVPAYGINLNLTERGIEHTLKQILISEADSGNIELSNF